MAGRPLHKWDRLPGWPPVRADHRCWRFPSDDMILAILWVVVVAGLIALAAMAVFGLFGAGGPSVDLAYAAEEYISSAGSTMAPPSRLENTPILSSDARGVDVSATSGVSAGTVLDSTIKSGILNTALPYRIYLPPGYFSSKDRYPVLYLLHGGGAGYEEWTDKNHLGPVADSLILNHTIVPMLIVMPEGDHSYFMNHASGGPRWGDYIAQELVQFIDANYRTVPDREHRAIGGLSMGGEGALQLALNHPDVFSIVGADSPSLHRFMQGAPDYFGDWSYYSDYDPLWLAATRGSVRTLQIWLDVGAQDGDFKSAQQLHAILTARGIDHVWHVYPGGHDNDYWGPHVPDYLIFYSTAFARNSMLATSGDPATAQTSPRSPRGYDPQGLVPGTSGN